jgi:predicted RNA-binding protein YlqC (UPF0109 family)
VNHAKSIVEFLARALADEPELVRVTEADHHGTRCSSCLWHLVTWAA